MKVMEAIGGLTIADGPREIRSANVFRLGAFVGRFALTIRVPREEAVESGVPGVT